MAFCLQWADVNDPVSGAFETCRSHPGNTIVAANNTDDRSEQGGKESCNAEKTEHPKQQNTMMVDVSRDRYVERDGKDEQDN